MKCINDHCFCRMLQTGEFVCCKCGKWENEPELKTAKK